MTDKRDGLKLLHLPPEILHTIAWHMDPGTFFVSLLTCKTIYDAAKYRRNLLRHLHSIPGLRLGLEDLTTADLLLQFRKRAAASLCGAGVLADISRYAPADNVNSIRMAVFSSGAPAQFATVHDSAIVRIYELTADHVRLKAELRIQSREDAGDHGMEVLKIAFSSTRDLAVLYSHKKIPTKVSPFVDEEETQTQRTLRLVTFHYCYSGMRGHFYSTDEQETTDITQDLRFEPAGLALASNGNFCISWTSSDIEKHPELWLCGRDKKLMAALRYDSSPQRVVFREPFSSYSTKPDRLIFDMQFVRDNKAINFYQPGDPIHRWYTHSCDPDASESGPVWKNRVHLDLEKEERWQEFHVGMPFHGVHTISVLVSHQTVPLCAISFLAIGIHHDVDPFKPDSFDAFIVQAESHSPSTSCSHTVDLESGRRNSSWKAIALLAGWRQGTSSLGTVMAVSPGGSSIASATWSRVLVWTFSPRLLHQGELQHYFPVHDYNPKKGIGRLRPFLLKPAGVVYNMLWISETVLYATTDHGLVKWEMGNMSVGEREELSLSFDAWPETAVAMPLTG